MTKKDLEDIIQTAKAAGANVKVVQVGSAENEPVERPKIKLFKLEATQITINIYEKQEFNIIEVMK